jgi:6,7-dimethyl-8-ribityllumazine synthase
MPQLIAPELQGQDLSIAIVQSRFNQAIGHGLLRACLEELERLGVSDDDIAVVSVPGALEIPIALQKLAQTSRFDALIALGVVIRGETYHFEVVANESARGVSEVSREYDIPVANAILTCESDEQAEARMAEKGADAARVAVEMANLALMMDELGEEDDGF